MDMSFLRSVPGALPKPEPRKRIKARKDREDAQRLEAFRDAVWERESRKLADFECVRVPGHDYARCQICLCLVMRSLQDQTADVHHRIGRRIRATRYDVANGLLLCNSWANDCHGKVTRHELDATHSLLGVPL